MTRAGEHCEKSLPAYVMFNGCRVDPCDVEWVPIEPGYRRGLPLICGIYAITHRETQRSYMGSSVDVRRRLAAHRSSLRRGTHTNRHLQRAWVKYGAAAFDWILVIFSEPSELMSDEQIYLDTESDAFNMCEQAGRPPSRKGLRNSPEHRAKVSAANLGIKRGPRRPETAARISAAQIGKRSSAASCERMSKSHLGIKLSPEHCAAISRATTGRRLTAEHRANVSAGRRRRFARLKAEGL